MKQQHFSIFEHQTLRVGESHFTMQHWQALSRWNAQHQHRYVQMLPSGVRFRQYVGVLQVGNLTIEVLPKADKYSDVAQIQTILVELLQVCQTLPIQLPSQANVQLKAGAILQVYIRLFLQEIEQLLHQGLYYTYHTVNESSTQWRGNLHFPKQLAHNLIKAEQFYTTHSQFDAQHWMHQVIYTALHYLAQTPLPSDLEQQTKELLQQFPTQKILTLHSDWASKKTTWQRSTQRYQAALQLAQFLLQQTSPSLQAGDYSVWSILVDMNQLFEIYIYKQLQKRILDIIKIEQPNPTPQLFRQPSRLFWERQSLRPDLVLRQADATYILDTKWKILQRPTPDEDDLKQMYVYNTLFDCTKSILIYPNVLDLNHRIGTFHKPIFVQEQWLQHRCQLIFVDLVDTEGRLNREIGKEILELIG